MWNLLKKRMARFNEQEQAMIVFTFALGVWVLASIAFAFLYDYHPYHALRIPEDLNKTQSVCFANKTCIFAIGGAYSVVDTFLPLVETFDGSVWGSEPILPHNLHGTYGEGATTYSVVLGGKIYIIGHKGFGYMYSYNGAVSPDGQLWTPEPRLRHPREGFAMAVYRNRIYTIGGRTLCQQQSLQENPDSQCLPGEEKWYVTGRQSAWDSSGIVESIDPTTESEWTIECSLTGVGLVGNASKCLQTKRSGASAAVYMDRLFVIGGYYGGSVEIYDGDAWSYLEHEFPFGHFGAISISFANKLWVFGGYAYDHYLDTSIVYDGKVWVAESKLMVARGWGTGCVLDLPPSECANLTDWLPGDPCQRIYVLGGSIATTAIASMESFDGQNWRLEAPLLNKRNRLSAVVFVKKE